MEQKEISRIRNKLRTWMNKNYPYAWDKFKYNIKTMNLFYPTISSVIKISDENKVLLHSFIWRYSPEGKEYWQEIHLSWLKYCLSNMGLK